MNANRSLSGSCDAANPPAGASMLYGVMGPYWRHSHMRDPADAGEISAETARIADILLTLSGRSFVRAAAAHTGRAETELWEILLNYPVPELGKLMSAPGWSQLAVEMGLNDDAPFVATLN